VVPAGDTRRVGLIGVGLVGASFAYALMQSGVADELVLIDVDTARAEGEAMDLNHGLPFTGPMRIWAGTYGDLAAADVVVFCAGRNQRPGETRLDLLRDNVAVFADVVARVEAVNSRAILVVATNPVDLLTDLTAVAVGSSVRVIGSGTILDTARFRTMLGEHYAVDPRSVHAYIVGEHGDSEVPLWSSAMIGGVRLEAFTGPNGRGFDRAALDGIFERTRTAAYEIIRRKRATSHAIGLGVLAIVEAVLRDRHTVFTVSSRLDGQHGVTDVALSLPTVVGRRGVERLLTVAMSVAETEAFRRSAETLCDLRRTIGAPAPPG
jgi:L-lactate dehydrogenase